MSRTIGIRKPAVLIAASLLAAGSATVLANGVSEHNPKTMVDVPYAQPSSGAEVHGLTPVDREAAQRLAELRAQLAADFACIGPAYPARPC